MKRIIIFLLIPWFILACSKDEKSSGTEIVSANIADVSNSELNYVKTVIESETGKIYFIFNNDLTDITFPINCNVDLQISSGAILSAYQNGELTFSNPDNVLSFTVTAEDGTTKNWSVFLVHKQLQNNQFENWFENKGMNGEYFDEIGLSSAASLWSTANMGTSTYGVYGSKPITLDGNKKAEIKTQTAGNLPITAGTLFTGVFSLTEAIMNPTDPRKATDFGIPFIFRPKAIKIKFKYKAGADYIQATLVNPSSILDGFTTESIDGEDQCTIYVILESRINGTTSEIGRAELISGTTDDILEEKIINFEYSSSEEPTHITVVFASSKDGDLWRGAVGSTLVVDDLEMVYE